MATSTTVFAAKDVGFSSTVNRMQGTLAGFQSGLASFAVKAAGLVAVFVGVRSAVQAFGAAIDMGGRLNDLSARTGETAGNLAVLQRAFENAGAGADSVGPTINRLQRAIVEAGEGGKEQAESFGKLGLNLERLKDLTPTQQLQAVAEALQAVGNDSERTQLAMSLLGRSGGELIPLLRAMGVELETAKKQLGGAPAILDRTSQHLDTVGDNFKAIGEKGTEFMLGFMEKLAPVLADVTTRLANIDAAGFGAKLSEYAEKTVSWLTETFRLGTALNQIEVAIKAITSGNFADGFSLLFMAARNTAFNAINEIVAAATAGVTSVGSFLSEMFGPYSGLVKLFSRTIDFLGSKFEARFASAVAELLNFLPYVELGVVKTLKRISSEAEADAALISGFMGNAAKQIAADFAMAGRALPEEFAASYAANAANPLIDMNTRLAEAEALTAGLASNIAKAGTAAATVDPKVTGAKETDSERLARIEAEARATSAPRGGGGGGGSRPFNPTTDYGRALRERGEQSVRFDPATSRLSSTGLAIDRTASQFSVDKVASGIRSDLARLNNKMRQPLDRAQGFEDRGMFGAAERLRARVDRRMAEKEKELANKYGLNLKDQAKTPEERKAEEQAMRDKHAPSGGKSDLEKVVGDVLSLLKQHMPSIDEKLPQHALVPG
jgi:hypothetical protein